MPTATVTLKIDEQLKRRAEELFSDFGLTLDDALVMFVQQSVRDGRIPLDMPKAPVRIASDDELVSVCRKLIEENAESYEELAK